MQTEFGAKAVIMFHQIFISTQLKKLYPTLNYAGEISVNVNEK